MCGISTSMDNWVSEMCGVGTNWGNWVGGLYDMR